MSKLIFNEEKHEYWLGEKQLTSVNQLLRKHNLAPDFSMVDSEVLKAKAERGTLIHKEIEHYIKTGKIGFTDELQYFIQLAGDVKWQSEIRLHNEDVAGTCDLMSEDIIADIKTSLTIKKSYLSWQLSLYEYLSGKQFTKMLCYHLCEKSKVIEIERIPREEIERLIWCEKNGLIYENTLAISSSILLKLEQGEKLLKKLENDKAEIEKVYSQFKQDLINAMQEQGVKSFENDTLKITYVEPSQRVTIDSKRLKAELPEVAKKFEKTSQIGANVRIKIKE